MSTWRTQAAVLFETGKPLRIIELEVPPLRQGQVLVRVAWSGICRSQLMEIQGKRGPDRYLPHLLGHEGSGVVEAVGEGVTKVKSGDHVVLTWIKGNGMDVPGPTYKHEGRVINAGPITTFSTLTVVSENRCVKIPRVFPLDLAALFGCALPTGAGIVMNELKPKAGSRVAVFGLGGIGLSALIALNMYDCCQVIAVDCDESKLVLARELGATEVIHSTKENPVDAIRAYTGGAGVDYSVEASGTVKGIEEAFVSVRKGGGLCIFASHPPAGERIRLDPHDLISGRNIQGSWGGSTKPDHDILRMISRYRKGKLPLDKLVSDKKPLGAVNEAVLLLDGGHCARVLLGMPHHSATA